MKLDLHPELARAKLNACMNAALAEGAGVLLSAARERCPVDSGRLRGSGYAGGDSASAEVGFSAPYAACVHEKGSKFLENAVNDSGVQAEILSVFVRLIEL